MGEVACGWSGCNGGAEATLDGRSLCHNHFYEVAMKRMEEYRARVSQVDPPPADRIAIAKMLSDIISGTTALAMSVKFLGPWQRDKFFELSLSAAELYKQIHREPRVARNMPILIYRETDSEGNRELTNTINVSKRGACVTTGGLWQFGEKIWIERPHSGLRTLARVAWVKEIARSQFLIGLRLLDNENFWGLSAPVLSQSRQLS